MDLKLGTPTSCRRISPRLAFALGAIGVFIFVVASVHLVEIGRGCWKTREGVRIPAKVAFVKSSLLSPGMRYSYEWKGTLLTGERLSLFAAKSNSAVHLKGYDIGDPLEVWIDPADPSYTLLDRSWRWGDFLLILFVLILSGTASIRYLGIAAFGSKPRKKRHFGKPLLRLP